MKADNGILNGDKRRRGRPIKTVKWELMRKVPQAMKIIQETLDGKMNNKGTGAQKDMAQWLVKLALEEEKQAKKPGSFEDKLMETV